MPSLRQEHIGAYNVWKAARQRCNNPNCKDYPDYGGRGIEFKFKSFDEFITHLGPRPEGMMLDRIDNSGNYEHGNVKWSTPIEQSGNRRNVILYEMDGKKQHLRAWAREYGIKRETLEYRVKKQRMSLRDALTFPVFLGNYQMAKAADSTGVTGR